MKILFVDDSKVTIALMGQALRHHRHHVMIAGSVREAREVLGTESVDLLITDLNMPGESGLDLARWVRAEPRLEGTPILMLTADFDPASLDEARSAGVDLFIEKTFCADELGEAIEKAISGLPGRRTAPGRETP